MSTTLRNCILLCCLINTAHTVAHSTEIGTNIALGVLSTSRVGLRRYVYGHQSAPSLNCAHVSLSRDDFEDLL